MDSNNLKELKEHVDDIKKFIRKIDEDNISFCYKKTPLIFDWKSEGFKIVNVLIDDLLDWLCYLGLGDSYIADEEVEFINYCLDLNLTKDKIQDLADNNSNKDYKNSIPVSFMLCYEAEIVDKRLIIEDDSFPAHSVNVFALFYRLGESFIACDDEITADEKSLFDEYLKLLWKNLDDFKTRRGIDETYDHLIGKDMPTQNITITTNPNKKITTKMNLVLKLLSQGYSLYDLDNIANVSINIIVKWLYRGRLGEKNFEEFYSKSIELNSTLEFDMDYLIEQINIDDVDDELVDYSKSDNSEPKQTPKPKNEYYKLRVNGLTSKFQSTEKNIYDLIEKCFPAPQMTNNKFNHSVKECSKVFFDKVDNIMMILESAKVNSNELENAIKVNISLLNEINDKLEYLHEELLINMSKSGSADVENLFDDMDRLTSLVKDYRY